MISTSLTQMPCCRNLEAMIRQHERLELFGQPYSLPDVLLQATHAVISYHKPQLQRTEAFAEGNLPMLRGKIEAKRGVKSFDDAIKPIELTM
jgi:hypothetical protein